MTRRNVPTETVSRYPNGTVPVALGKHLICDMYGASALVDVGPAKDVLRRAGVAAGATVLQVAAHDFGARAGFTGFALLAESHISVHTWPEFGIATVDIFMCGAAEPEKSLDVLLSYFRPERHVSRILPRGGGMSGEA